MRNKKLRSFSSIDMSNRVTGGGIFESCSSRIPRRDEELRIQEVYFLFVRIETRILSSNFSNGRNRKMRLRVD
jgi:hypothetical protein